MSTGIKIYALSNPINNSIFYVGATKDTLGCRLKNHLTTNKSYYLTGIVKERIAFMNDLVSNGNTPKIILLKEVTIEESNYYEEYYYNFYLESGNTLMQDPSKFKYFQSHMHEEDSESHKKFTMRVMPNLYNSIKEFADQNEMTFMGAIRFILNEFFKK